MKRTSKQIKQQTEEWLDERWMIANMENVSQQNMSYYEGALKALEFAGYDWERDAEGKHTLYKNSWKTNFIERGDRKMLGWFILFWLVGRFVWKIIINE